MALDQGIIRFDPEGPPGQGLEPIREITPDEVEAGSASELCHDYYTSPSGVLSAGIWKCTAHTLKFGPSPVDEFMLVLAGSVHIVYADGSEDIFRTGDAFVIPKGLPCQWKQTESIHKVYVILDDPKSPMPEKPVSGRAVRLAPTGPEGVGLSRLEVPGPENFAGGTPTQHDHTTFEDTTHRFFAGTWASSPMRRKAQRFGRHELMCLLEGGMTLTADGVEHTFSAPEVVFEQPDTVSAWTSTKDVRKYYCLFEE